MNEASDGKAHSVKSDGPAKALCLFFFLALTWPFLGIADGAGSILGIPSLLFHIFAGWGLLVLALFALSRKVGG